MSEDEFGAFQQLANIRDSLRVRGFENLCGIPATDELVISALQELDRLRHKTPNRFPNFETPPTNLDDEELWFIIQNVCGLLNIPHTDSSEEIESAFRSIEKEMAFQERRKQEAVNELGDLRAQLTTAEEHVKIANEALENIADGADDLAVFLSDYDSPEEAIIAIGLSCRKVLTSINNHE